MKIRFSPFQEYIAYTLLIGLLLQSCGGGFDNRPLIASEEKEVVFLQPNAQAMLAQAAIQPLVGQTLAAEGDNAVTFYEYKGELQASVEPLYEKYKVYNGIPLQIEEGTDLVSLLHLPKEIQQKRIHIQLAKGNQPAKVVIYKGAGLMGGMLEGEEEATEDKQEDEDIPNEYFCPITQEIMEDPVMTHDGHTYERSAIERWFATGKRTSPKTLLRLLSTELTPNYAMRSLIQDLKAQIPVLARHKLNMDNIEVAIKLREEEIQQELELKSSLLQQQQQRAIELEEQLAQLQKRSSRTSPSNRTTHFHPNITLPGEEEEENEVSEVEEIVVFCGNPGVGKSTLCNSIFQKAVFNSGVSKQAVTICEQKEVCNNKLYIDTPGLADTKLREQAAREIEKALKHNDNYKIVFVVREDNGRMRYADFVTIDTVCKAITTSFEYGVIFNQVEEEIAELGLGAEEDFETLDKKPSLTVTLTKDKEVRVKQNVFLSAKNENRKKLLWFLNNLKANRILRENVAKIDVADYDAKIQEMEIQQQELATRNAELSARNEEQAAKINVMDVRLQHSTEELKKQKEEAERIKQQQQEQKEEAERQRKEFEEREYIRSEELRRQQEETEKIRQQQQEQKEEAERQRKEFEEREYIRSEELKKQKEEAEKQKEEKERIKQQRQKEKVQRKERKERMKQQQKELEARERIRSEELRRQQEETEKIRQQQQQKEETERRNREEAERNNNNIEQLLNIAMRQNQILDKYLNEVLKNKKYHELKYLREETINHIERLESILKNLGDPKILYKTLTIEVGGYLQRVINRELPEVKRRKILLDAEYESWHEAIQNSFSVRTQTEIENYLQYMYNPNSEGNYLIHMWADTDIHNEQSDNFIIKRVLDLNTKNEKGLNPLHIAIQKQDISKVKLLLKNGASTDIDFPNSKHPLIYVIKNAIKFKDPACFVKALLKHAERVSNDYALMKIVTNDKIKIADKHTIVDYLLESGAYPHPSRVGGGHSKYFDDIAGWSPIYAALERGDVKLVEKLFKRTGCISKVEIMYNGEQIKVDTRFIVYKVAVMSEDNRKLLYALIDKYKIDEFTVER
jgi:ankyrin repeat protein